MKVPINVCYKKMLEVITFRGETIFINSVSLWYYYFTQNSFTFSFITVYYLQSFILTSFSSIMDIHFIYWATMSHLLCSSNGVLLSPKKNVLKRLFIKYICIVLPLTGVVSSGISREKNVFESIKIFKIQFCISKRYRSAGYEWNWNL